MATNDKQQCDQRIIGRWTMGETLRVKQEHSIWVKRGQDIKTGDIVELTFIEKDAISSIKQQAEQLQRELDALKNISHKNIINLYAYNLNAKYPLLSDQKEMDTILLVSENIPHELFDVLYYTSALKENIVRTFFCHIINGLEACHNVNIVHTNITPNSLTLDKKYNVKIADFAISKIIKTDVEARGYKAPELLSNDSDQKDIDHKKCDIFSIAVILFVLLAGYPPFNEASKNDKWYKSLIKGNVEKFWKWHARSPISQIPAAKDLLTKMLIFDAKQRIDIKGIKSHEWLKGNKLRCKELKAEIRDKHRKAEKKRRQDVRKMNDVFKMLNPDRTTFKTSPQLKLFPQGHIECAFGEVYTYLRDKHEKWYDLYTFIEKAISGNKGQHKWDNETERLRCTMNVARNNGQSCIVEFDVEIFESRLWKNRYKELDEREEILENNQYVIFVVRITRIKGDRLVFNKLKNGFMLRYCSSMLRGLPEWALKLQKQERKKDDKDHDDIKEPEFIDEYGKEVGNYFVDQNKGGIQFGLKN